MAHEQKAIVLTALPVEYLAVRAHLTGMREVLHPKGTVYEQGTFSSKAISWQVAIVEIGQGNPAAALEAERAIQHFAPDVILFIGIAGGIKDVVLGDVVAGTKIYEYESGKDEVAFKPRPNLAISSYRLEQRARAEAKKGKWIRRIKTKQISSSTPSALVGPIAAGAKVLASLRSATSAFIRSQYSDALAVEKEGYGFLAAVHANPGIEALVVRGISDLIDDKGQSDAEGTQEIAAKNASAFAFEVLASFDISVGTSDLKQADRVGIESPPHGMTFFTSRKSYNDAVTDAINSNPRLLRAILMGPHFLHPEWIIERRMSSDPRKSFSRALREYLKTSCSIANRDIRIITRNSKRYVDYLKSLLKPSEFSRFKTEVITNLHEIFGNPNKQSFISLCCCVDIGHFHGIVIADDVCFITSREKEESKIESGIMVRNNPVFLEWQLDKFDRAFNSAFRGIAQQIKNAETFISSLETLILDNPLPPE